MITSGLSCDTLAYMRIADFIPGYSKEFEDYVRFRVEVERWSASEGETRFRDHNVAVQRVDKLLRVRWDYLQHDDIIIERLIEAENGYMEVCMWPRHDNGQYKSISLVESILRENDMQRFDSPEAYHAHKSELASKRRESNDKVSTDKILEAVDKLSTKQRKNFLDVERAMVTGDRISFHGDDAKSFEHMRQASLKAEAEGNVIPMDQGINPGMHPLVHRR